MQILKEQGANIKIESETVLGGKEILLSHSLVSRWNRLYMQTVDVVTATH